MLIPDNIKCVYCSRIFCCPNCRKLHEEKEHAVVDKETIHKSCFICHGKAYPLQKTISQLLMDHIVEAHMPLHCRKCDKIYNSKDDFKEIEKCVGGRSKDDDTENKENLKPDKEPVVATTKIIIEEVDEELLTPLSKINLKWRRKSAGFTNSDSSTISHPNQSQLKVAPDSASLVRTTSTPMNELLTKPRSLDSLCGSSYQASSIDHSSGCDTDQSASITSNNCSPSPALAMKRTQFPIQRSKQMKNRLPKAQTPLRQVMSKSIQRALIEQRNERTKFIPNVRMPRKMIFDSMSSSDGSMDEPLAPFKIPHVSGVLDLRTTPVIKRTMSDPQRRSNKHWEQQEVLPRTRQKSDESLMVEALIEEHYHQSEYRANIEAISDNVINESKNEPGITPIPLTPVTESHLTNNTIDPSGMFQSCVEDKTPVKKSAIVTPMQKTVEDSFAKEIWYSPKNMSQSFQLPQKSPETFPDPEPDIEDEVFVDAVVAPEADQPQNRIWRLFSTVMRIASGSLTDTTNNNKKVETPKGSLVKRSLSHLGLIRPTKRPSYTKSSPTTRHLKRKRQKSSQSSLNNGETPVIPELKSPIAKKYKSITGRKPIQRMMTK